MGGIASSQRPSLLHSSFRLPRLRLPRRKNAAAGQQQPASGNQRFPIALLPEELLAHVFVFLSPADLALARTVCKQWRDEVDSSTLWREKCLREGKVVPRVKLGMIYLDYKTLFLKNPYGRNLIQNWDADGKSDA